MSRKVPTYEDYFRISDPKSDQNALGPDTNLRQAAELLCDTTLSLVKTALRSASNDPHSANANMSEPREQGYPYREGIGQDWQQTGQHTWDPQYDDMRRDMGGEDRDPQYYYDMRRDMGGEDRDPRYDDMRRDMGGEGMRMRHDTDDKGFHCERLRPLETSESYREPEWGRPENRRPDWGPGMPYRGRGTGRPYWGRSDNYNLRDGGWEDERNPNYITGRDQYDTQYNRDDADYHPDWQPNYNREPYYNKASNYDRGQHGDQHSESQVKTSNEQQWGQTHTPAPKKGPEVDKEEEEEEDSDEDVTFCKLCNVHFDTVQKYYQHTRGLLHTQRQMDAQKPKQAEEESQKPQQEEQGHQQQAESCQLSDSAKNTKKPVKEKPPEAGATKDNAEGVAIDNADAQDDEDDWEEEEVEDTASSGLVCELCDIKVTGIQALRAHESGRSHKLVQEAIEKGTIVPQRIYGKLGPNAKIPVNLKPVTAVIKDMKPTNQPSCLLDLLKSIPEAVVGTAHVKEGRSGKNPTFLCITCETTCDPSGIVAHLIGSKHRMKFLRAYHPAIYEHVRSHGGKKSQLSSFLEEICSDIEKEEGRKEPVMERPKGKKADVIKEQPKEEAEKKEEDKETSEDKKPDEQEEKTDQGKTDQGSTAKRKGNDRQSRKGRRTLPHDVAVAMYKGEKMRQESGGTEGPYDGRDWGGPVEPFRFGRRGPGRDFDPPGRDFGPPGRDFGPPDRDFGPPGRDFGPPGRDFGPPGPDYGPLGRDFGPPGRDFGPPGPDYGPLGRDFGHPGRDYGPPGRDFGPHGRDLDLHGRDFGPAGPPNLDRDPYGMRPDPYPPFFNYPDPYMSEEERRRRMYEYESHLFNHPMLLVSPAEARDRMLSEYQRLGVPYEIACDRIVIQEERRIKIMDYMKGGLTLKEAQSRLGRLEKRQRLIRDFELQGLDSREARWKAIVEEERSKLYEKYEDLGFTPLEARAKILAGEDRTHLIQEFERHGMTPEEAYNRAVAEEETLKRDDASRQPANKEQNLDYAADLKMMQTYMEQGDNREQAENKVIAILRRQGVPTQEAILRVQKLDVKVPEKRDIKDPGKCDIKVPGTRDKTPPKSYDDQRRGLDREGRGVSRRVDDFDSITPEEAKERLFQEYEKRGVPREKARLSLIQELIRSGVSEQEARRRFSDTKPAETGRTEGKEKRKKYTGYEHRRSSSDSDSDSPHKRRRRSLSAERKKYSKSRQDERTREDVHYDRRRYPEQRKREEKFPFREEQDYDRGRRDSRDRDTKRESQSRPTLTLGEELKLKARKLKREEFLSRLEESSVPAKRTKPTATQSTLDKLQLAEKKDNKSVAGLLESLTDNLISSEDNESAALSMSKALTSALLKYRLSAATNEEKEKPSGSATQNTFVERRIQDAKKLFESKMLPQKDDPTPSGSSQSRGSYGGSKTYGLPHSSAEPNRREMSGAWESKAASSTVRPESFGLPPPLPAFAQESSFPPQSGTARSGQSSAGSSVQPRHQPQVSQERKPIIPRVLLSQKSPAKEGFSSSGRYRR